MGRSRTDIKLNLKKRLQNCSREKYSSSKDPENLNWLVPPCSQKSNTGAAASSIKEEESREKPTTPSTPQVQRTATSNTVLAKSLPFSMDKSELIEFFKQAGEVVDARCNWDNKKRLYIEYATVEAANKALELDGQRNIRVYPVRLTTGASKILVAKNLKPSITKSQVIEFFKQAAVISDVRFSFTENGDFRGHCHIEFATEHGAKNAAKFNGEYLLDRPVWLCS
ncbi:hypothetical protein MKW94_021583 [Papaver nudicaule]|uniref:RRM domain-containing protein n=1 Tax=Papaver nudicaule TaxID=74823 RepID=A0AA41VBQ7_PAPNU|nr:hypothetical protein [Papaver nudicaule]